MVVERLWQLVECAIPRRTQCGSHSARELRTGDRFPAPLRLPPLSPALNDSLRALRCAQVAAGAAPARAEGHSAAAARALARRNLR